MDVDSQNPPAPCRHCLCYSGYPLPCDGIPPPSCSRTDFHIYNGKTRLPIKTTCFPLKHQSLNNAWPAHKHEMAAREHEWVTRDQRRLTRKHEQLTHDHERLTHKHELLTHDHERPAHGQELVTRNRERLNYGMEMASGEQEIPAYEREMLTLIQECVIHRIIQQPAAFERGY